MPLTIRSHKLSSFKRQNTTLLSTDLLHSVSSKGMKIAVLFLLFSWTAAADRSLRGNSPNDPAPQSENRPGLLAKLDIDDEEGSLEFVDGEDVIFIEAMAKNEVTLKRLKGLGPEASGNPIAVFQHFAPPGQPIPRELLEAKRRVDQKIREQNNNPVEYREVPKKRDQEVQEDTNVRNLISLSALEETNSEEKDDHSKQRKLLCLAPPDYPYGSNEWWYQNYCHPSSQINQNECTCYTRITGLMWHWAYDDRIDFYAYAYRGNLWLYSYVWKCGSSCYWEKLPYERNVQQGYWGHVWTYGPYRYYKGEAAHASGDGYHWSFHTTHGSCTYCRDTNTAPAWCEYCQKRNFTPNL